MTSKQSMIYVASSNLPVDEVKEILRIAGIANYCVCGTLMDSTAVKKEVGSAIWYAFEWRCAACGRVSK